MRRASSPADHAVIFCQQQCWFEMFSVAPLHPHGLPWSVMVASCDDSAADLPALLSVRYAAMKTIEEVAGKVRVAAIEVAIGLTE